MPMIPTGFKSYQVAGSGNAFLVFDCEKCKERNIKNYTVYGGASVTYHAFNSSDRKEYLQESARAAAKANIESNDQDNYEKINILHDYSGITNQIACKKCGQIQTWSTLKKWSNHKLFPLWAICFGLLSLFFALSILMPFLVDITLNPRYFIVSFIYLALLVILLVIWLRYRAKQKKKVAEISNPSYPMPIYVNAQNYEAVLDSFKRTGIEGTEEYSNQRLKRRM